MFNVSRNHGLLVVTLAGALLAGTLPAKEPETRAIEVGRPVADVLAILRERRIEWSEGGFQETRLNKDVADIFFTIDEATLVRIFYSKTTATVTGIAIVIYPVHQPSKITRTDLSAKSIRLESDGSYVVHFLPPNKNEIRDPLPKDERPSSYRR